MKKFGLLFLLLFIIVMASTTSSFGAVNGDYQSKASGSGNWADASSWQIYNNGWGDAVNAPDGTTGTITIQGGYTMTVGVSVAITSALVVVNGYLKATAGITGPVRPAASVFTFNNGSTYEHAMAGGTIPWSIWNTGSTCLVTGTTGATPAGTEQNFYNFTWNCPNQSTSLNLGWGVNYPITISGDYSVKNTKTNSTQLRLTTGSPTYSININGNFLLDGATTMSTTSGNSGTVTVNIGGDIRVTNGGVFSMSNNGSCVATLYLTGNLSAVSSTFNKSNAANASKLVFKSIGIPQTIDFTGATTNNGINLEVNNGSTVTLNSDVSISTSGSIKLTNGQLWLGAHNITFATGVSITVGNSSSYVVFDNVGSGSFAISAPTSTSSLFFPVGNVTNYTPLTLSYTTAPTVTGKITLKKVTPDMNIVHLISTLNDGGYSIGRRSSQYWSFTNTVTGGNYSLSIDGSSGQLGINDPTNLRIINSTDGGTTFNLVGTHAPGSGTAANRTGIPGTTSGSFYLGGQDDANNPLPVELSSFTASNNGRNIQLNWSTKTEKNSDRFEIQRSLVGNLNWAVVGSVKAAVLSNSTKSYSYSDTKLQSGKYQYRLKMVDNNGSFAYSNVEAAEVAIPKDFSVSQNYPNPFNPSTKIDYQVPVDAKVVMEVYNIAGQKVIELVNQQMSAGYYTVDFGASKLSSGVYIYRVVANDIATGHNFSSIKKMMLLK